MHWNPEAPQIYHIEPDGESCPTTTTMAKKAKWRSDRRSWITSKSKQYRDQLTDLAVTIHQLAAINNNTEPKCPSPRTFYKGPKREQSTPQKQVTVLQRPKETAASPQINTPLGLKAPKTLAERQEEYDRARARIFARTHPKTLPEQFQPP